MMAPSARSKSVALAALILLLAFSLRAINLTEVPPGLTHDEANHGREALGILDGAFLFFFPLNYGSEPLYSYTVAGSMSLLGENLLSLRLVNAVFSLLAMAVAYLWARRAFGRSTALLAMALTAVSFWPLASGREALRAGMLPFFMAAAVWFFWQIIEAAKAHGASPFSLPGWLVAGLAVSIATMLHIYLAARVAWLLFPAFLLYLALFHRPIFRAAWLPALLGMALAGLMVTPMFLYLKVHPEVLTRLDMLDGTLQALRDGDPRPVLQHATRALLAFIWPGYGDKFLAYNIPGRPVFDALSAVFFVAGVIVAISRWRRPSYAFLLLWFGVGILPSLITGPTANTTRNLAAISAVHLLPAVGFVTIFSKAKLRFNRVGRSLPALAAVVWMALAGSFTVRDYFVRWAQSPEVRGAYQHTLVEALAYLERIDGDSPVVVSSVFPGPAHDPSIALVLRPEDAPATRWVDARYAFLFPAGAAVRAIVPSSTPLHPAFSTFLHETDSVSLRPDDLDPSFAVYYADGFELPEGPLNDPVDFGGAVTLLQTRWLQPAVNPGETAELLTVWRVVDPKRVGPAVLPLYTTDVVLFTQVLDGSGNILSQRDSLEAPSWDWAAGDTILQIHPVRVPGETPAGTYQTIIGLYDRLSGERRPVLDEDGEVIDDHAFAPPLRVLGS